MKMVARIIRSQKDGTVRVEVQRSCAEEVSCVDGMVLGTLISDSSGTNTIMSLASMDNDIGNNVAHAIEELLVKAFELGVNEAELIKKSYPPP